ncbi:hypothetical protein [Pedobacter borealis]|uniref:hypothetical protein n=1 Tax=Pedobacter borealis TaxID=475254 RepID=UPI000A41F222|nr:hypothetical protein [Pedobacter borealis]
MRNFLIFISCYFLAVPFSNAAERAQKTIVISTENHVRVRFGAEKLSKALVKLNYSTKIEQKDKLTATYSGIAIGVFSDKLFINRLPLEIKNKNHPVDFIRWYLPDIEEVMGYGMLSSNGLKNQDTMHFIFKAKDGRIARVSGAYTGPTQPANRDSGMSCILR